MAFRRNGPWLWKMLSTDSEASRQPTEDRKRRRLVIQHEQYYLGADHMSQIDKDRGHVLTANPSICLSDSGGRLGGRADER